MTALSIVAKNTGASEEDIKDVISGMIISAKNQHGSVASDAELAVFTGVCARYGLNPLVRECAAFISSGKLQTVVMIDGWYKLVNRQETFDGVEFEDILDTNGKIASITCKMFLSNRGRPVAVTEYLSECFDAKSSVWKKWPARMLRHKAYIQAARMAFGISEVIDNDEADRIKSSQPEKDVTPQTESVDYSEIEAAMAECGDIKSLDEACLEIRKQLEGGNAWANAKAKLIAMKVTHRDRINTYSDTDVDNVIDGAPHVVENNEVIEGVIGDTSNPDIGFVGDDETDEFGD